MNVNDFTHLLDEHYAEDAKRLEEEMASTLLEAVGAARRLWREIRAGLIDEGVPNTLVDDVTGSCFRAMMGEFK